MDNYAKLVTCAQIQSATKLQKSRNANVQLRHLAHLCYLPVWATSGK